MDKENFIMTDQYKRIQGATLRIQGKKYCVYKGVNTIGRNKTAIINVKNLNVSQHHAVIMIVDDNQHFISDLNSSNGTYLVDTKLSPYKLYELSNNVEIKFGDTTASYFKVSNLDTTVHLETETQNMTQNMTQNFYGATQIMIDESCLNHPTEVKRTSGISNRDIENIHDAATQVVIYPSNIENIHEAATQVVFYPSRITNALKENSQQSTNCSVEILDSAIHEAPTQVVDYQQASTSTVKIKVPEIKNQESDLLQNITNRRQDEIDIHEMPTQVVIFPQGVMDKGSDSSTQSIENVSRPEGSSGLNKSSENNLDISKSFGQIQNKINISEIIEETVVEENPAENIVLEKSNDSLDFLSMQIPFDNEAIISNEEIETKNDQGSSFPESQDIGVPRKHPARKLSSSEDLSQVPINKRTYDSDSDTNVDNEIIMQHKKSDKDVSTKKLVDSGSDTEIEDILQQPRKDIKCINSDSETDMEDNPHKTDILSHKPQGIIKPKILLKKQILDSDSETDIDDDIENKFVSVTHQKENSTADTEDNPHKTDILSPQSQGIIKPKILSKKQILDSDSETDTEDDIQNKFVSVTHQKENSAADAEDSPHKTDILSPQSQGIIKPKILSKKQILDSDSETNTENDIENKFVSVTHQKENSAADTEDNPHKTDILSPQSQGIIKPKILSKKQILDSDSETDIEDDKENKFVTETHQKENNAAAENLNDTDCIPATQDAFTDIFMYKDSKSSKTNTNSQNQSSEESFKLGLTELMVDSYDNKGNDNVREEDKENSIDNEESNTNNVKTNEQILNLSKENRDVLRVIESEEKDSTNISKNQNQNADDVLEGFNENVSSNTTSTADVLKDDFYMMATQKINEDKDIVSVPTTSNESNIEKEIEEDIYMMPTQNINNKETESQFKTPQKKFNFKKRGKQLDESLSKIFGTSQDEIYSAETQKIHEEDIYLQPTQKLNENSPSDVNFKCHAQINNDDEDMYLAPTQRLDVNLADKMVPGEKNENMCGVAESLKSTLFNKDNESIIDISLQPTQDLKLNSNIFEVNKNKEDLYMAPTQQLDLEETNKNLQADTHTLKYMERKDENLYMAETQAISSNLETEKPAEKVKPICPNQPISDLYLQETQAIDVCKNSVSNENDYEDPYLAPTQQINQNLDSMLSKTVPGKMNSEVPQHISDIDASESKRIDESNADVETLTQIDAFIKQPFIAPPKKSPKLKGKSNQIPKKTTEEVDQSETLSQIERFVKEPFEIKKPNIKTLPKKGRTSHIPNNETVTAATTSQSKTLKQSETFVEKPSNNEEDDVMPNKMEDKKVSEQLSIITSSRKRKAPIESNYHVSKEECGIYDKSEVAGVNLTHNDQESVRGDVEKSFALLEAKSSKTRKSRRLTSDSAEIKVNVCRNRRSMATSAIAESSDNIYVSKPLTRKSRKKSATTNNNNVIVISDTDNKVSLRSKRKIMTSDTEETKTTSGTPRKMVKRNTAAKSIQEEEADISSPSTSKATTAIKKSSGSHSSDNDANTEETRKMPKRNTVTKSMQEEKTDISSPSTSKATRATKKSSGSHSSDNESNKSNSEETKRRKMLKRNTAVKSIQEEKTDIFSPSTSKATTATKKSSGSYSSDNDTNNSNDITLSTPSRRGRRNIQNTTVSAASPEKAKRKQKPKIVFTMLDSPLLESLIRQMGGSVVDSVESSTVLITEHVKRSQKLLTAIGHGKPICSPEWIHASKKTNDFLDPWDYILLDKEAESKWNFSLKESLNRAKNEKLLANYTFQLFVNNAVDVLKGAIEACGGKCVPRYPAKNAEGFFVIVASPENRSKYIKIKKQHPQVTVVEPEAIFDGVLRQDLRLGRHLLT